MSTLTCTPYRGYRIDVQVTLSQTIAFSGGQRRYTVFWSIFSYDEEAAPVASFPESIEFLAQDAAFRYGEKRAHAFIDCTLSCESK
jgi:hypothetical protein